MEPKTNDCAVLPTGAAARNGTGSTNIETMDYSSSSFSLSSAILWLPDPSLLSSVLLASVSVSTEPTFSSSAGSCLLRSNKIAEEVGLEIARENSEFCAVEEEFVGALVGTRIRQHSTCQRNCSKKMAECLLKFYVIQQMRSTVTRKRNTGGDKIRVQRPSRLLLLFLR